MQPLSRNMAYFKYLFICILFSIQIANSDILCESGFCRTYGFEVGCTSPAQHCRINNATHTGMWLPSPTICNCCEFCLPFFGKNEPCSVGGPGIGITVGRCGDGLSCVRESDGHSYCRRMESKCHRAQDDYDERHTKGETGALEQRPVCDGKGRYASYACVPTQTCFCQSDTGSRLFGEVLNLGSATAQNMHCRCSQLHEKIRRSIVPGVRLPVIGPRCTSDGNFNPVQCVDRTCYCVDKITGVAQDKPHIDLHEKPLSELDCYEPTLDLFPEQNEGQPPYNYTTPCIEFMQEKIDELLQSEEDGFNVDFFSEIPECLPDGTFGRVVRTRNGSKICVDERGQQIDGYEAQPNTQGFNEMNCKCAQTSLLMSTSNERPICCKNGNFRTIQCRRGQCRCVDSDGRQYERESADVTQLSCFAEDWRIC